VRILFATAELSPVARVGGLAEASAGLVRALRAAGVDVDVMVPDYDAFPLADEQVTELPIDAWAGGTARLRRGHAEGFGEVTLVDVPGLARPHPYLEPRSGMGWPDNDRRFFTFANAIAANCRATRPDLVHLNDWHTAPFLGMCAERPPTVFTIHTIGYQGVADASWFAQLPVDAAAFEWYGRVNPLAAAIRLSDLVIAVSPTYAREIVTPESGMGLHELLAARGDRLVGIRNGIDTAVWDPSVDPFVAATFVAADPSGKTACRRALVDELGWPDDTDPVIGMVTRLTEQKGIDIVLDVLRFLATLPARFAVLGAGDRATADALRTAAAAAPDRIAFVEGYDNALGHRIFAGSDLFLMPSRFEPCGLAQMQAMAYGTIPVVTDVGGLHDTVLDDDRERGRGTGFVSQAVDSAGITDALHRAVRAHRSAARRKAIVRRGMRTDWSWHAPAAAHLAHYETLLRRPPPAGQLTRTRR
jgi:starch synthase